MLRQGQGVIAGPRMRIVGDPESRATAMELWRELRLKHSGAAVLADELKALLARYERRSQ